MDLKTPPVPANEAAASPPPAKRGWILAALMTTMLLAAMDSTIVATAIPQIVGDLGGFALFGWVFSIYLLAQTVTIPIYGKLADIFGRKVILMVGASVFLLGSAACALAWNMTSLIVFRGLQGLGAGSIMATVATLAGDLYSVRERATVQGWLSSVWGMAAISGPVLGGALAEYVSWRWIFLVNVPIGAAAMGLLAVFLRESFERRKHVIDYAGAVLVLLTAGLFILGLLEGGQRWAWTSWPSLLVFSLAFLFGIALVYVERRAPEPVMPGWLWRRRVLAGSNLATACMGVIMMAPDAYLPTFAQSTLGLGAIAAGLVLASMSIGWPLASSVAGRLYLRIGFRQTALAGAVFVVAAMLLFVLVPRPVTTAMAVALTVLLGAGFGLISTPLLVGVQSVVEWNERGVVTGTHMFSRYLGASLGAALMGTLFNARLRKSLDEAPAALSNLPDDINEVITVLHGGTLGHAAESYLRDAIGSATTVLYVAGSIVAVVMVCLVLWIPRRFETTAAAEEPRGP